MDNGTEDLDRDADERVRRDLAALGSDEASAPEVPDAVTARVVAALRAEPNPPAAAHTVRRPPLRRLQVFGLVVGIGAVLAGVILGTSMWRRAAAPTYPVGPTAEQLTVARPAAAIPLPDSQILRLLSQPPDFGPLTDPGRRGTCLTGLGYPSTTQVLGATPLQMHGRPAVLLLVPSESPDDVVALVVEPNCDTAHPGLLTRSVIGRT